MRPRPLALGVVAVLVLAALIWPALPPVAPLALLLGLFGADALLVRRLPAPEVRRRLPATLPVNGEVAVALRFRNPTGVPMRLSVTDGTPVDCHVPGAPFPAAVRLEARAEGELSYRFVPFRRGEVSFDRAVVMVASPLGLWERRHRCGDPTTVRVYPDFSLIAGYLELLAHQQSVQLGIRRAQRRGEGLEFLQLREYRAGDSLRQIDWKATSRRGTLISREYQEERDQRVLLLIDSGRRMRTRDGRLSHFDHALNALLLLAYVALRQGDTVSVRVFGHEQRWLPPERGAGGINALLHGTYDLQTGTDAADFLSAAEDVMRRQRKRSLVVLVTNLREEDSDLLPALTLLRRRHVVLIANLRERVLDEMSEREPSDFDEALGVVGAHAELAARRQQQRTLGALGNLLLDCVPEALPVELVNAYWRVKGSGVL